MPTIALGRSCQRSRSQLCWLLWEGRQGRSSQRTWALEGPGTPTCTRAGSVLARAPVPGGFASRDTNAEDTHNGKGNRGFYAPGADPCVLK